MPARVRYLPTPPAGANKRTRDDTNNDNDGCQPASKRPIMGLSWTLNYTTDSETEHDSDVEYLFTRPISAAHQDEAINPIPPTKTHFCGRRRVMKSHGAFRSKNRNDLREGFTCSMFVTASNTGRGVRISGVLIDSGADATFISRNLVRSAGFRTITIDPVKFVGIGQGEIICNKAVDLSIYISGVHNIVRCLVDETQNNDTDILFGTTGIKAFMLIVDPTYGPGQVFKATVAPNVPGRRRDRFVLCQSPPGEESTRTYMSLEEGVAWSQSTAVTTRELEYLNGVGRASSNDAYQARKPVFEGPTVYDDEYVLPDEAQTNGQWC